MTANDLQFLDKDAYDADLHPMHCTDMIWASVINQTKLHIRDGYSRDKGTPLVDEHLPGGENNLVAAFGLETMERTIVMFRRLIVSKLLIIFPNKLKMFSLRSRGSSTWTWTAFRHLRKGTRRRRKTLGGQRSAGTASK
jgi:hypothetical protein